MKQFGIKDKLGYMCGDLGNDLFFLLVSSYLMKYYTDVMGFTPASVGLLLLCASIWYAFSDVIWGRLIDSKTPTKEGKFRPWIRKMALPLVIFGALIFFGLPIDKLPSIWGTVLMFGIYIIWGTLYSSVNIPYGSMAAVITQDPVERSSLSTFRSMGAAIAGIFIGFIVPMFCFTEKEVNGVSVRVLDKMNMRYTAIAFAIVAFICYMVCYKTAQERIVKVPSIEKVNLLTTMKGLKNNQALLAIIAAAIVLLLSTLLGTGLNSYLFTDYFKNTTALTISSIILLGTPLVIAPFVGPVIGRFGKKEASSVAMILASIIYFLLFMLPIHNVAIYVFIMFLGAVCSSFFTTVIWAFITDVIDYQEFLTGIREDATIYSMYSFSRKIGQAAAGGLTGFALSVIGYATAKTGEAVVQTAEVANGIRNIATIVPAICYALVALILIFWYPLGKDKIKEINNKLRKN